MATHRYELTDTQWERIAPLLAGKAGDVGRTAVDNRLFLNAILWISRSGAPWRDLPLRYGRFECLSSFSTLDSERLLARYSPSPSRT